MTVAMKLPSHRWYAGFDAGANAATVANRAAGTNFAQPVIDVNESTVASDGTKQIQAMCLTI